MNKNTKLTKEELKNYEYNRNISQYVLNFKDDGVSYPIPDLIGSTRLIAVDEDTVGAKEITFGFSEFAPLGAVHKPHTHPDCEEIMYILSGKGIGSLNGEKFIAKEEDILYVPKGAEHSFYNPFDIPCKFLFLYTKGSLKRAGYTLASRGGEDVGTQVEEAQKSGNNEFDDD